jgi:ankyrin repeat protein
VLLLAKDGIDLNSKSESSLTLLLALVMNGHEAVVALLLMEDGIDLNSKSESSLTPLL